MNRPLHLFSAVLLLAACDSASAPTPPEGGGTVVLTGAQARVVVDLDPFAIHVFDAAGDEVLTTLSGGSTKAYGGPAATHDDPFLFWQILPGWDGYQANEAPWRSGTSATPRDVTPSSASFEVAGDDVALTIKLSVEGARVHLGLDASATKDMNKTSIAFELPKDGHFFGLGERFASVDHRGLSLYSWAEEGGLAAGEGAPIGPTTPYPNGPSMTYFPVPFFLSNRGYGLHLETTFRSETHFGSDRADAFRLAVGAAAFDATIYVHADPLETLADYTEDTGRPPVPAPWVFGPRRRVDVNATVGGVAEWQLMRDKKVPMTSIDDAIHFLPALSQTGREAELATWTSTLHDHGYKAIAYNNPYVAEDAPNAAADYAYGVDHGYFVLGPDGTPTLTEFISGTLVTIATIDLSNPDAALWFQSLLQRTLDSGYDGWMHDFGEYIPRDAVVFDGSSGEEFHNRFPVLSAKAAYDLLEQQRPGDYLFYTRSGGSGTQAYVPAVWSGDAEATFDESQGLPSAVRGGLNLSMTGVPYWGSDMTGFKCLTSDPNDKEMFLRWVELGAVSPIMMEENACSNPITDKDKWTLWSDDETTTVYASYARLHTRLAPYFTTLAAQAHLSGRPITLHPFLLHPTEPRAMEIDDAFYLGPALYAAPVVARGATDKTTWLPPGRFVDLDDHRTYDGGADVTVSAPLEKLPLFLVAGNLLPMLDASIDTLAPATDPTVVTPDAVADRLDVLVALADGQSASLTLDDGTVLEASRAGAGGNPDGLDEVTGAEIADCASCYVKDAPGDVTRVRANGVRATSAGVQVEGLTLSAKNGPSRRVRWEVLVLP